MTSPQITAAMVARSHGVAEPRLSADGALAGWIDSFDGRSDLVIAPTDASQPPAVVTADVVVSPLGAYGGGAWCFGPDGTVLVATAEGPLAQLRGDGGGVIARVNLPGRGFAPALGPSGTVALCVEDDDRCSVATIDLTAGRPRASIVSRGADYSWDPAWSRDGQLAWHEWDLEGMSWDASRIATRDRDGRIETVAGDNDTSVGQPRFSPDGRRLAYVSDESGWWNVVVAAADGRNARPLRAEEHDHSEPAWGPGQRSFAWAPDSRAIAYCRNEVGFGRLVVASLRGKSAREVGKAWHHGLEWNRAGIIATRSGARTPQQVALTDATTRERRVLARGPVAGFESAGLVEPEAITWRSRQAAVHGLLYRPSYSALGVGAKPPLFVHVHGGPTDQSIVEWNARIAYWVSRGWAVLAPNYRGSTGYGRGYWKALEQQWGVRDVDDTVAGIRHVARQGWSDPRRIVVSGGSAGGFTALLVAARYPMLARAIVSLYGVADLRRLARTTHRFESRYLDRLVGDIERHGSRYDDRSPVNLAHQIATPTLVLQGSDDPVVPLDQARAIVRAIRANGTPVESHVYRGEGHGFRRLEHRIDELQRTERFLTKWVLSR